MDDEEEIELCTSGLWADIIYVSILVVVCRMFLITHRCSLLCILDSRNESTKMANTGEKSKKKSYRDGKVEIKHILHVFIMGCEIMPLCFVVNH